MQVTARPYDFALDPARVALVVIDMQRDFIEPGGFGDTLGNDVAGLKAIVPTVGALIGLFRQQGLPMIHTREAHRPGLSDCPPAKRLRGAPGLRIGDQGAMGRILIAGEPGNAILPELAPLPGEIDIDKPGKGMFWATGLQDRLQAMGWLTHVRNDGPHEEGPQWAALKHADRHALTRAADWVLVLDIDEFVNIHAGDRTVTRR